MQHTGCVTSSFGLMSFQNWLANCCSRTRNCVTVSRTEPLKRRGKWRQEDRGEPRAAIHVLKVASRASEQSFFLAYNDCFVALGLVLMAIACAPTSPPIGSAHFGEA